MASCSYRPLNKQGEELLGFQTYRKALGYTAARDVFIKALSPNFQEDFKNYLKFDEQQVPTFESVMTVPYIKNFLGAQKLIDVAQKKYVWVTNTRQDYERLVSEAYSFNTTDSNKDLLTAIVETDGDKIRVKLVARNVDNDKIAANQYGVVQLNKRLSDIFSNLGVTVGTLEQYEAEKVNGMVDFNKAASMADGFESLIRIANSAEGVNALPEEFSHLLIGIFRDEPLVRRSLNMLNSNLSLVQEILGDEYQAVVDSYEGNEQQDELVAEEALGKVLQQMLLQPSERKDTDNSIALNRLISRLINWLKSVFKQYDINDVVKARQEVSVNMRQLSSEFLSGNKTITKEDIANSKRNAKFNQLRDDVENVLQLVQNALDTERKRLKIVGDDRNTKETTNKRIATLSGLVNDKHKLEGLITYAKWALSDLSDVNVSLDNMGSFDGEVKYKSLRNIQTVLQSYSDFIHDFRKTLDQYKDAQIVELNGEEVDLADLWRRIDEQFQSANTRYEDEVVPASIAFMAPFYYKAPVKDKHGNVVPLERFFRTATKEDVESGNLFNEDMDISWVDKWGTAMAYSSSIISQLYNAAVEEARKNVKSKTTDDIRDIWALREKAEKRGITSFEWMFEKNKDGKKTGYYISEYNYGQFDEDYNNLIKSLNEKYGDSPFGEDYTNYKKEEKAWLKQHAVSIFGKPEPNESYLNPEYKKLSKAQLDTLNEFLDYKSKLETGLPRGKTTRTLAIQRRKSSSQRFFDAMKNPKQTYKNIEESLGQAFKAREDDDQLYGNVSSGLTDFTDREFLTLPVLYTRKLKNPEELSTDVYGDLMAYSYTTNTFKEMDKIVDPLEIGKEALKQKKLLKTRGGKPIEETINVDGRKIKRPVYIEENNNNLLWRIQDFMETQIYGRYVKPQGTVMGLDAQKSVSAFQRLTSMAYLGCNYFVAAANIATAAGMQNIEVFAGEHFGAKELLKADGTYAKLMPEFMAELTNRNKQSEIALFDELFDVKVNFKDKLHNVQMKGIFKRFFGKNWMFIQQGMGDHWVYNRTALAMAMRRKVKVNGKEMSVWDARKIITDENGYKKMIINPDAKNLDGSDFDAYDFSREIREINHHLMGIYNDEDMIAAQKTIAGKLVVQMRQWMIPQMLYRFQGKRHDLTLDKDVEGYYRTFGRLAKDVWKGGFKISSEWDKLSKTEKANVVRAVTEMTQAWGLWLLASAISSGVKDPDRIWALKFADYMINREAHELGFLAAGPTMISEGIKTVQSPVVAASAAVKVSQFITTTMNPLNWVPDESRLVKSGKYEGHGYIYKRFMELPLPYFTQVRQIEKFVDDLDTGTRFYSKDYK